jgi:hypothetical protein
VECLIGLNNSGSVFSEVKLALTSRDFFPRKQYGAFLNNLIQKLVRLFKGHVFDCVTTCIVRLKKGSQLIFDVVVAMLTVLEAGQVLHVMSIFFLGDSNTS